MKLSRADLEELCERFKAKALQEHDLMRTWMNRALDAEEQLRALTTTEDTK